MWSAKISVIFFPFLYLLLLLLIPVFPLLFLPALIVRRFVSLLAQIFGGSSLGKILSANATSHACIRGRGTSLAPFILEGTLNLEHIRNEFTNKVLNAKDPAGQLLYPELRQTVVSWGGYLFWEDIANFQLPIRLLELPEPVDLNSPSGLKLLLSFYGKEWKFGEEPLWEVLIVPGLEGRFGFVLTFDHALCDALGMQKLVDKFSHPSIRAKPKVQISESARCLRIPLQLIYTLIRIPYDAALFLEVFMRTTLLAKTEPAQSSGCDGTNGGTSKNDGNPNGCLTLASTTFSLPDLKKTAAAHGASVNALLMSSVQASLQKLWDLDEERSSLLYFPTPDPNHPEKLRNLGGIGYLELFHRHRKPEERLHHIDNQLQNLRKSTFPLLVSISGRLSGSLPPSLLRRSINGAAGNLKTFLLSTFVVSRHPFSICGYPVVRMGSMGSGHAGTKVVAFFAFSCADLTYFTVMGDQGVVNEAEGNALLQNVAQEFEFLAENTPTDHISVTFQGGEKVLEDLSLQKMQASF